jgi:hypothetical protein
MRIELVLVKLLIFVVPKVSKLKNVVRKLRAAQQQYLGLILDRSKRYPHSPGRLWGRPRLLYKSSRGGGVLFLGMNQME